jgi:hypothetical protein
MKIKPIIVFLFVFEMLFFSCETTESKVNSISYLTVTAKSSSEGINLFIGNIPKEATHLSVSLYDITANDQLYTGTGLAVMIWNR